jgi:predicted RNA-binding Zn-ribbon protein involved in translation (DUF1610 family)
VRDEALTAELLRRANIDQRARRTALDDATAGDEMLAVDTANTAWLREVIDTVGWPGRSLAGDDGAAAAWLLAQHADLDPDFQRRCLGLLAEAVRQDDAAADHLAYLTDRVRLAFGEAQEYGTQVIGRATGWAPARLRDPDGVDERRASVGLPPLADYLASIAAEVPLKPSSLPCPECGGTVTYWLEERGVEVPARCDGCGWTSTVRLCGSSAPATADRGRLRGHRCRGAGRCPGCAACG